MVSTLVAALRAVLNRKKSLPPAPMSVSLPAPPLITLTPLLPVMVLLSWLPVRLIAMVESCIVYAKFSIDWPDASV